MSDVAPVLLLTRSAIAQLARPKDYLSAMQAAFMDLAAQRYALPSVGHIPADEGAFHIKAAARSGARPLAAIKVNGNFPGNLLKHGLPTIQGFIALFDAERGCVLALLDSIEITARRTAAATALAARHLAKPGSRALGMVGCGVQARYHLDALLDIADIANVRFYDTRDAAADEFARHAAGFGIDTTRMSDARATSHGADIVVTTTTATRPVLELADVDPGTFVAAVGADNPSKNELAADLLRASRVVVDILAQSATMGDLHHAIRLGAMTAADVYAELADVVAGRVAGRSDDRQRFVFDSTGTALQDLAAAEMIYQRAQGVMGMPRIALNDL